MKKSVKIICKACIYALDLFVGFSVGCVSTLLNAMIDAEDEA